MPDRNSSDYAKALYDHAATVHRGQDNLYAISLLEKLVELGDPFYTPFALSMLAQSYNKIGREDLESEAFRRVARLQRDQQELLNPRWLATSFLKSGDLHAASATLTKALELVPNDSYLQCALAEVHVLSGDLERAASLSEEAGKRAEANYQLIGRMIHAFALALGGKHDQAARDFSWVAQFLISSGTAPTSAWDFRDLKPLVNKMGPSARAASTLIEVLTGGMPVPEFIQVWGEMTAATAERNRA